jgi:site-specific DNA-methyltransferase (adenine-specific)
VSLYYQDDYVTLYHGDCLEQTAWLEADVLVTDPPYGIAWKGISTGTNKGYDKHSGGIAGDNSPEVRDAALKAWGDKPAIVFGSWKVDRPAGTQHRLIWHKAGQAPGPLNAPFMTQDEEIYILGKGFRSSSPPMRSVIRTDEHRGIEVGKIGHPTPKPIRLMELLIDRCPDGLIADPFAGSGSTLLAARNLGRKTVGVELNEEFCELIAKRLSQDTFDFSKLTEQVKETYTQESLI